MAAVPGVETLAGSAEAIPRPDGSADAITVASAMQERIGTISYIARLADEERAEVHERVRALGRAQPRQPFAFRYRTTATICRRRGADYPLGR